MKQYYLFNNANETLIFHANNNKHAIELGKDYAHKLGWTEYAICYFNGEQEVMVY